VGAHADQQQTADDVGLRAERVRQPLADQEPDDRHPCFE
jgi:hypothetical protein